jgi:lipopolysaccharide transport system ATP-binding protein
MIKKDVMSDEVLVKVEGISKKFCKSLKRSMVYGIQDIVWDTFAVRPFRDGLRKDEFWAVDNISFELKRGECLGLIGPNGAGKSTLLKMLNGIILPDRGRAEIRGRVGALIEIGAGFHPMLTGRENVYLNGSILGFNKREIANKFDEIVEFAELSEFIDTPVKHYSSGMYVRLGFAIAAQMEPDVLLVDEVLAVGDVGFRAKCFNTIYSAMRKAAVVLVSHSMPDISRVSSSIMVMNHGKPEYYSYDVPKGIDLFYSHFKGEQSTVAGNGRATICHVEFESNGKKGIDCLNYLDHLSLHIHTTVDSAIKYPNISVVLLNQELQNIAQCHSYFNDFKIRNSGKDLHILLDLGKINLNPGLYSLEVAVTSENRGEVLCKVQNVLRLRVTGQFVGYAPVQLKGDWKVFD